MEIEFTVVKTEVLNGKISQESIETIKEELIKEFGGLTVEECRGSWLDNGKVYEDINEKWLILTQEEVSEEKIMAYAERIRVVTKQIAQLYRIEYKFFLIDAQGVVKEKELAKINKQIAIWQKQYKEELKETRLRLDLYLSCLSPKAKMKAHKELKKKIGLSETDSLAEHVKKEKAELIKKQKEELNVD